MFLRNRTPMPSKIAVVYDSTDFDVGVCEPTSSLLQKSKSRLVPYDVKHGTLSKSSLRLGVRFDGMTKLVEKFAAEGTGKVALKISPIIDGADCEHHGILELEADIATIASAENRTQYLRKDVVCKSSVTDGHDVVMQAAVKIQLIDGKKIVSYISLEPRAMLVSTIPLRTTVVTRLPHCYSTNNADTGGSKDSMHTIHELEPGSKVEVYSAGEVLAVKVLLSDPPSNGTPTGTSRQWILIPLTSPVEKPILCLLPFVTSGESISSSVAPGSEFFIAEASPNLPAFFLERINDDGKLSKPTSMVQKSSKPTPKTLLCTVANYGIDHTSGILFEQMVAKGKNWLKLSNSKTTLPFGGFAEVGSPHRVSLLPTSEIPIRLVRPGPDAARRTALFRVEEVSMSRGGAQATPILWEDGSQSGYFAYRTFKSSYQSELHIIPEFVCFNGSLRHPVIVKQAGGNDVTIAPNSSAAIFSVDHQRGLALSFHYKNIGGGTKSIKLDELGVHIELVRTFEGQSLGSVAIQTSIGSDESRLLIKLGEVGEMEAKNSAEVLPSSFKNDNLRFRIQAEEFAVTLHQATSASDDQDGLGTLEVAGEGKRPPASGRSLASNRAENPICTILMKNCTYDMQKIFKEKEELKDENDIPERCQLSLIVHDFKVKDETPGSPLPLVFKCTGESRFLDFCVRTKGPLYGKNVKVDLVDLILAHPSGRDSTTKQNKMYLQTTEQFMWKLIDTADLISQASKEPSDRGDFDETLAAYVPIYSKDGHAQYTPPQVSTIYDIKKSRVSEFNIVVSFRRNPDAQRYEKFINSEGAHLMRYFTQQLKFTINGCDLHFARYEEKSLKGPHDRLIEILTAVYISRMKLKVVAILAAASFGDWKELAARDGGDDEVSIHYLLWLNCSSRFLLTQVPAL